MRLRPRDTAAQIALLLAGLACNDDSPGTDPVGGAGGSSAGASGTAGAAGTAGTSAGAGGSAGASDAGGTDGGLDGPDAAAPRIHAVIDDGFVRLSSDDAVWVWTCNESMTLRQQLDGAWVPLQDDRPEGANLTFGAHFLDGAAQPFCRTTLGCDFGECQPIDWASDEPFDRRANLVPREFVQVGEGAASTCDHRDAGVPFDAGVDLDAGIQHIPVIESRAPRGPLVVRVQYYTSPSCEFPFETVDVPVQ